MQWPRQRDDEDGEPATLVLRVEGPAAIEIQHLSRRHHRAGQPLLRLAGGRPHRAAPGAAGAPARSAARRTCPTDPEPWPRLASPACPDRSRTRLARRARPAGRRGQADVTASARRAGTRHCHNLLGRLPIGQHHRHSQVARAESRRDITRRCFRRRQPCAASPPAALRGARPSGAEPRTVAELCDPGPLGDMVLGAENAPVTIIEYASMTCPHCAALPRSRPFRSSRSYIDTGKVRFIFREFPLDPLAAGGFMLARCAGKDKYFPLIDLLFSSRTKWAVQNPIEPLFSIAKQAGFSQEAFNDLPRSDQKLPTRSGRMSAQPGRRQVQGQFDADLLHQRQTRSPAPCRSTRLEKEIEPYLKASTAFCEFLAPRRRSRAHPQKTVRSLLPRRS